MITTPLTPLGSELNRVIDEVHQQKVRKAFVEFAGHSFFSQLISSMRKTVDKPAYFHGGRAETVFQGQLDDKLVDAMTESTADSIAGPMYELFALGRPQ